MRLHRSAGCKVEECRFHFPQKLDLSIHVKNAKLKGSLPLSAPICLEDQLSVESGPITMINTPDLDNEFIRDMSGGMAIAKWVAQKINPTKFEPIENAINWNNINAIEQNQALGEILINSQ